MITWTAPLFSISPGVVAEIFGLKGRFCQTRAKPAKPWEPCSVRKFALKGRFGTTQRGQDRMAPSGPTSGCLAASPGLWPGLTETALQAENSDTLLLRSHQSGAVQL